MKSEYSTRGFVYKLRCRRAGKTAWEETVGNLIPAAGLAFLAQAPFGAVTAIGSFHLGLFSENYIPQDTAVSADLPLVIGEFTGYAETSRPLWDRVYTDGTHTNVAAPAEMTVTAAGSRTIYGAFVNSSAAKGSNNGLLLSVGRFDNPRPVITGDILDLTVYIALVAVG